MIERSDFDASGKPMMNAYGYSTMRYSYDEHGREIAARCSTSPVAR
jgi:hypothetical protein